MEHKLSKIKNTVMTKNVSKDSDVVSSLKFIDARTIASQKHTTTVHISCFKLPSIPAYSCNFCPNCQCDLSFQRMCRSGIPRNVVSVRLLT